MTKYKLLGNSVYLEAPKKEEGKIIVDHNTKEDLKKELLKKMKKLKVVAIGVGVSAPQFNVGDFVLVNPNALAAGSVVIPISDTEEVILVSYYDIIHQWL